MIGFYSYTVILTYVGFICGSLGIYFSFQGKTIFGIAMLLIAGFCDMFDGKVARTKKNRTPQECKFGIQIDSLSDMVCFGFLPVAIAYSAGLNKFFHVIIFCCFSLAALIRLAYFNVTEEERQEQTTEGRKLYEGLPVTSTALLIPALFVISKDLGRLFPVIAAIYYAVIAVLFITKFHMKKSGFRSMILFIITGTIELLLIAYRHFYKV